MTSSASLPKSLLIFAIIIPLALVLGYLLTTPLSSTSLAMIVAIIMVLLTPIMLKWHHPILLFAWNAPICMPFMPSDLRLWMVMVFVSLTVTFSHRILNKETPINQVKAVTWSLFFLLAVLLFTAQARGGIGIKFLGGSTYGGKNYVSVICAIMGYFAISMVPVDSKKASLATNLYILPGVISALSHLIVYAGPAFFFLFLIISPDAASVQFRAEERVP